VNTATYLLIPWQEFDLRSYQLLRKDSVPWSKVVPMCTAFTFHEAVIFAFLGITEDKCNRKHKMTMQAVNTFYPIYVLHPRHQRNPLNVRNIKFIQAIFKIPATTTTLQKVGRDSESLWSGRSGVLTTVGGNRFSVPHSRPNEPWGSRSLLCSGYRDSFRAVKRPGRGVDHPPHLAQRLRLSRAILLLPLCASNGMLWGDL
jgi:hypothetical protein